MNISTQIRNLEPKTIVNIKGNDYVLVHKSEKECKLIRIDSQEIITINPRQYVSVEVPDDVILFEHVRNAEYSIDGILPVCATSGSAAYDFFTPIDFELAPGEKKLIWTNIKVRMPRNVVLMLNVRSNFGKLGIRLANTIGYIDSDYYDNLQNEGNIGVYLENCGKETITFMRGNTIAQGCFVPIFKALNGNTNNKRVGGFGSTGGLQNDNR